MNNIFSKIKNKDERQGQLFGEASWLAIVALFVTYLIIGFIITVQGKNISLDTQLLFTLPIFIFAFIITMNDGFDFPILGIKEDERTLSQVALLRSVPWLLIAYGIFTYPLENVAKSISEFGSHNPILLLASLALPLLVGVPLTYYGAKRVREGSAAWIGWFRVGSLFGFLFFVSGLLAHFIALPEYLLFQKDSPFLLLNIVITAWVFYGLARYGGKSISSNSLTVEGLLGKISKHSPLYFLVPSFIGYMIFNLIRFLFEPRGFVGGPVPFENLKVLNGQTSMMFITAIFAFLSFWLLLLGAIRLIQLLIKKNFHFFGWALALLIVLLNVLSQKILS